MTTEGQIVSFAIPKFRRVKTLIQWMERNWTKLITDGGPVRLPREIEAVFFKTKKDTPLEVARCLARYSGWTGRLESNYEELLKHDNDCVVAYIQNLKGREHEIPSLLIEWLSGDSRNLYRASKFVGRLPEHLESTISDPRFAYLYAKEVLRGRLPATMEMVFITDPYHAAKYAFDVIRGFSPCRLPESLHSMMVMTSFEEPENEHIKTYLQASESDPSKVGNSDLRVR